MILGDSPMSDYLEARIESLIQARASQAAPAETDSAGFTERVAIGNLRPLLWSDWRGHLQAVDHDRLAAELDAELAAMTGPLDRSAGARSPGISVPNSSSMRTTRGWPLSTRATRLRNVRRPSRSHSCSC